MMAEPNWFEWKQLTGQSVSIIYKGFSLHSGVITFQLGLRILRVCWCPPLCSPAFWIKHVPFHWLSHYKAQDINWLIFLPSANICNNLSHISRLGFSHLGGFFARSLATPAERSGQWLFEFDDRKLIDGPRFIPLCTLSNFDICQVVAALGVGLCLSCCISFRLQSRFWATFCSGWCWGLLAELSHRVISPVCSKFLILYSCVCFWF